MDQLSQSSGLRVFCRIRRFAPYRWLEPNPCAPRSRRFAPSLQAVRLPLARVEGAGHAEVDALRDILDRNGEILPLSTDDGVDLFVLNARVVDALDEASSSLTIVPGTNRIMRLKSVAFVPSAIEGVDLFRLPHRGSATYVSERFVGRVKAAGLHGLAFNLRWSG